MADMIHKRYFVADYLGELFLASHAVGECVGFSPVNWEISPHPVSYVRTTLPFTCLLLAVAEHQRQDTDFRLPPQVLHDVVLISHITPLQPFLLL